MLVRASATPKSTEKKTICNTSLLAAASKKLCGTTCSSTPVSVTCLDARSVPTVADAPVMFTPSPGRIRFTAAKPITSAIVVTISKYTIERSASFPTRFMSSPCPAIPTTSVEKMSGTINSLIMRRKIVDSTLSDAAWKIGAGWPGTASGKASPMRTPKTIEMKIQCVSERRRKMPPSRGSAALLTRDVWLVAAASQDPAQITGLVSLPAAAAAARPAMTLRCTECE